VTPPLARDPIAGIVAFNRPLLAAERRVAGQDGRDLNQEAVARKLQAIARDPFAFFRGTFHLMVDDVLRGRVPDSRALLPEALIVGDLHLENFGVYQGAGGEVVFDVSDFDDVGQGPVDFDLKRLCTSALLLPGLPDGPRLAAAQAVANAWASGLERIGGRFPVQPFTADRADGPVRRLLRERERRTRNVVAHLCADEARTRLDLSGSPARHAAVAEPWPGLIRRALAEYEAGLKQLKAEPPGRGWELLDTAYRFKGTGSLGRLRFSLLLGKGDSRWLLEFKEARPSTLDAARGALPAGQRARAQTAAIRRLQGDPWPAVSSTHLGAVPALGREVQAEEDKLDLAEFAAGQREDNHADLLSYGRQCGEVLARLHARHGAVNLLAHGADLQQAARGAVAFARSYAQQVQADHRAFLENRGRVAAELGLPDQLG
jgi:uncharacterized protein (DUF2252 family)